MGTKLSAEKGNVMGRTVDFVSVREGPPGPLS